MTIQELSIICKGYEFEFENTGQVCSLRIYFNDQDVMYESVGSEDLVHPMVLEQELTDRVLKKILLSGLRNLKRDRLIKKNG